MKKHFILLSLITLIFISYSSSATFAQTNQNVIELPSPEVTGTRTLEGVIFERKSVRVFKDEEISLNNLAQILWAGQGITHGDNNKRTVPSAGAKYPLELYVLVNKVTSLDKGVYKYIPAGHKLEQIKKGDIFPELFKSAVTQKWMEKASVIILITGIYERTAGKYGERAPRYVHIEVGHAAQNISLQAFALNLGICDVGAFKDKEVQKVANTADDEIPFMLLPVGVK